MRADVAPRAMRMGVLVVIVTMIVPVPVRVLVIVPVGRVGRSAVGTGDDEAMAGEHAVIMRFETATDRGGTGGRRLHQRFEMRKRGQQAGREHVAGHATERVQMQMDHADDDGESVPACPRGHLAGPVRVAQGRSMQRRQSLFRSTGSSASPPGMIPVSEHSSKTRTGRRIVAILSLLALANLAAWSWAFGAFATHPALIGSALLAWGFGLRHAVDADHIAAIDNVTRKLMQSGRQPVTVGLSFSLGHSAVVVLASVAIVMAQGWFRTQGGLLEAWGAPAGTAISAGFLLLIGGANLMVLLSLLRRRDLPEPGLQGGLSRLLAPMFTRVGSSGGMFWLGLLFGLGFDTATEIGVLAMAATGASHGAIGWSAMVFPALFTAGMSLVDTLDGVLMLGAYGWAQGEPSRRRGYNIAITACSVLVALGVGLAEGLGLLAGRAHRLPGWIAALNDNADLAGGLIVGGFALLWIGALGIGLVSERNRRQGKLLAS